MAMYSSARVHSFGHQGGGGMYASTGGRMLESSFGGGFGGGMRHAAPPFVEMGAAREEQMRVLEQDIRNSRLEEERLRAAIMSHESVVQRNEKELSAYRDAMQRRDEEMRRLRGEEAYRLQVVMEEYRARFERERTRLGLALQKTDACTKIISEVLPECMDAERELLGGGGEQYEAGRGENGNYQAQSQMVLS